MDHNDLTTKFLVLNTFCDTMRKDMAGIQDSVSILNLTDDQKKILDEIATNCADILELVNDFEALIFRR